MEMNKIIKYILMVCILTVFVFMRPFSCLAMNTGFEVSEKSEDESIEIFERIDLSEIDEPEIMSGFCCFDVNDSGEYALGFDGMERDIILVYDSSGEYLYGFSFEPTGSFGFEWDSDNIILYRVRSNLAIMFDNQGNFLEMKDIEETLSNNEYWRYEVYANKRTVDDTIFTAEHWLINNESLHWGQYPRLVKTTSSGERFVLWDNTYNMLLPFGILLGICAALIVTVAVIIIVKNHHLSKKSE